MKWKTKWSRRRKIYLLRTYCRNVHRWCMRHLLILPREAYILFLHCVLRQKMNLQPTLSAFLPPSSPVRVKPWSVWSLLSVHILSWDMISSLSYALLDLELTLPRGCKQEHISADSSPVPFPQILLQGQINNETTQWEIALKASQPMEPQDMHQTHMGECRNAENI